MKPLYRGIAVAVLHCLIVLTLAGKYAWDREHLPSVWARTVPFDPNLPVRGRYVRLAVAVDIAGEPEADQRRLGIIKHDLFPAKLSVAGDRLVATPVASPIGVRIRRTGSFWTIAEPTAFFIPEHVPDPSRVAPGEELWVEVTVPMKGSVRPLRLGIKKDGQLRPLPLR
jgi:hypothetical protein